MFNWVVLPFLIFFARTCDVTLGTLRNIFLSKNIKYIVPLLGFFEVLFNSRDAHGGRLQFAVNAGLIYRLTPRLAVDAGVQTSLVGQGPDYVVRTGLSVLWR